MRYRLSSANGLEGILSMSNQYLDAYFLNSPAAKQIILKVYSQYPYAKWGDGILVDKVPETFNEWKAALDALTKLPNTDDAFVKFKAAEIGKNISSLLGGRGNPADVTQALFSSLAEVQKQFLDRDSIGKNANAVPAINDFENISFNILMAGVALTHRSESNSADSVMESYVKIHLLDSVVYAFETVGDVTMNLQLKKNEDLTEYFEYASSGIEQDFPGPGSNGNYIELFGGAFESYMKAVGPQGDETFRCMTMDSLAKSIVEITEAITDYADSSVSFERQGAVNAAEVAVVVAEAARGVLGMPARGGLGKRDVTKLDEAKSERRAVAVKAARNIKDRNGDVTRDQWENGK